MEKISREQFLNQLETNWQTYVERFHCFSLEEQKGYLEKQGYATFPSLLAHIIAWWQEGALVVEKMCVDHAFENPDYDVDVFNAQAVQKFSKLSEADILQSFESQRQIMRDLVASLPEADLDCDSINTRLYYEIIGHWSEHAMSRS